MKRVRQGDAVAGATRVGTAEFRAHLAKYLKEVGAGRRVIIEERGRCAYVITRLDDVPPRSVFGCMRDRTDYTAGAVVNGDEDWSTGKLP